jgi:putative membrane protein
VDKLTWKGAITASPGPRSGQEYLLLYIKGMLMGAADLVPGVSGGTVAFVTGIYENLLEAVASINKRVVVSALRFQIKETVSQVHVRFMATLGFGMMCSIFGLAHVMHYLMTNHGVPTWGLFAGLIGASMIVVAREVEDLKHPSTLVWTAVGAVFAYFFVGMIPVTTPDGHWFIFLCGIIAISAMILPGLSGSFLLLIFGKYAFITGAVKDPFGEGQFAILIVFACGAATGLLGFSKVLNYLLKHWRCQTMCVLTGILFGSMRKVWPWKEVLETREIRGKVRVIRDQNIMPDFASSETMLTIALMVVGLVVVVALDKLAQQRKQDTTQESVSP